MTDDSYDGKFPITLKHMCIENFREFAVIAVICHPPPHRGVVGGAAETYPAKSPAQGGRRLSAPCLSNMGVPKLRLQADSQV